MCSTWRAMLPPWLLQPVGLVDRGGRALPPGCPRAEGSAICVCYGRLPSHILRRRAGSLGLVVIRWLQRADEAKKSSIYIRPLLVVTRRGVGQGVGCVCRCPTRWVVFSVGLREVSREHRWAREDEVNSLRECNVEELWGDGADVHRKSGVPILCGLRWEEIWELESQIRHVM